jgi:hypothetical protein
VVEEGFGAGVALGGGKHLRAARGGSREGRA